MPKNIAGADQDFSPLGNAVIELLKTRDAAHFAKIVSPSFEDWQSIYTTNNVTHDPDALKGFHGTVDYERGQVASSAKKLLEKADALHLDFSKSTFHLQLTPPKWLGSTHYPTLQAEHDELPYAQKVEVVLEVASPTTNGASGKFTIALHNSLKFPGGWRTSKGVDWLSFPPNVLDEKTTRELAIMARVADNKGITEKDDPSLLKLGANIVDFIRARDMGVYQRESLPTSDRMWELMQMQSTGNHGPSRKTFDKFWQEREKDLMDAARLMIRQMDETGIDLKDAKIEAASASIQYFQQQGRWGGSLNGTNFKLKLSVKSDGKSRTGKSLSGDYMIATDEVERFGDDWKATGKLRWEKLPAEVADPKTEESLVFENYIAEHRALPPGTAAPEIEFIRMDNDQKMKLSDLRGKVVILDFWATWCGPCQAPMAELQKFRQEYPDWKDRVAIVPISIDDTIKAVRSHVEKRSWTNTFNVWAGDGGWSSTPVKTFRVTGVPTTYVIDQQGKVSGEALYPASEIGKYVNALLLRKNPGDH